MAALDQFLEYKIHLYIFRIFLPILLGIGTAGSITTIFVLTKRKHRSSATARFLLALAVTDLLVLWVATPRLWLLGMFEFDLRGFSDIVCKLHHFLALFSGQQSTFFIVCVTVDRFVCVTQPLRAKFICTVRNANIAIIFVVIGLFLVNLYAFFNVRLTEEGKCVPEETLYTWALQIVIILHVITISVVPIAIVLVGNACIITKLVLRKRMFGTNNVNNDSTSPRAALHKKTSRLTMTLVLLSATFLICNIPIACFYLLHAGQQSSYGNEHEDAVVLLFWSISLSIYLTNSAINFVLYFLGGSKFRKDVKDLCCSGIHCC